jgi:hypothetical protein
MEQEKIRYRRDLWKVLPHPGSGAEIGVAEGYFAAEMLRWSLPLYRVYLVDRWRSVPTQKGDASNPQAWHDKNFLETKTRLSEFGDRAVFFRGDSVEMAKGMPDDALVLVNIDCDHSFEGVTADIWAWYPKLVQGGVMSFHDYENPVYGVKKAVTQFLKHALSAAVTLTLLPEDKMEDAGAYIIKP